MDKILLRSTYVLLIIYNAIFFVGKYMPELKPAAAVYRVIDSYLFYFGVLEFLGVASIFIDLIAGYDKKPLINRRISLFFCAILLIAFMLKLFINWFHSALLVD